MIMVWPRGPYRGRGAATTSSSLSLSTMMRFTARLERRGPVEASSGVDIVFNFANERERAKNGLNRLAAEWTFL